MKNFKKVIETFEKNKECETIMCQDCAANVFMKEIGGTNCVDFLLDSSNSIFVKTLKELGFRKGYICKKNAYNAYIIATKLLEKTSNKI